jgi:hypothetical protein
MDEKHQFLFTEIVERYKFWQHLDKRIDTSISLFIGFISLITPIVLFIFNKINQSSMNNTVLAFLLIIIFLAGFLLLNRIYYADIAKSKTMFSINLIKQYFIDNNVDLKKYLYYDIYEPKEDKSEKDQQIKPRFHYFLTLCITTLNSIIVGFLVIVLQNINHTNSDFFKTNLCLSFIFTLIVFIVSISIYLYLYINFKLDK